MSSCISYYMLYLYRINFIIVSIRDWTANELIWQESDWLLCESEWKTIGHDVSVWSRLPD
jgi:hypothetical protein